MLKLVPFTSRAYVWGGQAERAELKETLSRSRPIVRDKIKATDAKRLEAKRCDKEKREISFLSAESLHVDVERRGGYGCMCEASDVYTCSSSGTKHRKKM